MGAERTHVNRLDALRAYLSARDDADPNVAPGLRSQMLPGDGRHVVVLIHGLTASPPAWDGIAPLLHARGATVVIPRLPLHGYADRMTDALTTLTPALVMDDLRGLFAAIAVLDADHVTVAGHSLGGTLALYAGATIPGIDRVVGIAPFLGVSRIPYEAHPVLLALLRRAPGFFLWWHPLDRLRHVPLHGYPRYPFGAVAAGIAVGEVALATNRPRVKHVDLVVNGNESAVSNRAVHRLAQTWRRAGTSVAVHALRGLPRSHDIIESMRAYGPRAREAIVEIVLAEHDGADRAHHL